MLTAALEVQGQRGRRGDRFKGRGAKRSRFDYIEYPLSCWGSMWKLFDYSCFILYLVTLKVCRQAGTG